MQEKILEICKRLHAKNLLAAADGNVSFKVSEDEILITPSGVSKAFMSLDQMAVINQEGEVLKGNASSEKQMHLQIYKDCPEAKAVIHAHPPTVIAFTIAKPELKELPMDCMSELLLATGGVPIVAFARPGSKEMGSSLSPYIKKYKALILARHGAVCWGEDLEEAYRGMERIEHSAEILYKAESLGGLTSLPKAEMDFLKALRKEIGNRLL